MEVLLRFKTLSYSFWGIIKVKMRFCEPIIINIPAPQDINWLNEGLEWSYNMDKI